MDINHPFGRDGFEAAASQVIRDRPTDVQASNHNDLRSFLHAWFAAVDHWAVAGLFLAHLDDADVTFNLDGQSLACDTPRSALGMRMRSTTFRRTFATRSRLESPAMPTRDGPPTSEWGRLMLLLPGLQLVRTDTTAFSIRSDRIAAQKAFLMSSIEGKVVVITGASSGIGEAAALLLAGRGAKVVLGARGLERLEALTSRIVAAGGEAVCARTDVKRRAEVAALVNLACERYGRLDVLVNNAGIGPIAPLDDLRVEEWEETVDINVKGVLYGIAAALPVFRRQGTGHFVNVASTAAHRIVPNMAVYCGTKFAVRAISEGLRQEAGDKLRVTVISPGFTRTNIAEVIARPEIKTQITAAMDKMAIPPDAIARAIVFAIEQPADVDVGEIIVRPTAQS